MDNNNNDNRNTQEQNEKLKYINNLTEIKEQPSQEINNQSIIETIKEKKSNQKKDVNEINNNIKNEVVKLLLAKRKYFNNNVLLKYFNFIKR